MVQVVFFDRSEVLLSPEARMVTYVNKTGIREEHSLEDVLHSGRSDISRDSNTQKTLFGGSLTLAAAAAAAVILIMVLVRNKC